MSIYLIEVEPLKKDIYYSIFMLVSSLKIWTEDWAYCCISPHAQPTSIQWS